MDIILRNGERCGSVIPVQLAAVLGSVACPSPSDSKPHVHLSCILVTIISICLNLIFLLRERQNSTYARFPSARPEIALGSPGVAMFESPPRWICASISKCAGFIQHDGERRR